MKKVFIIGSITCFPIIENLALLLRNFRSEFEEVDYVRPQGDKTLSILIKECYEKIQRSDCVIAVTKPDGSFGEGTTYEIEFAKLHDIPVYPYDSRN